jgi:protein TonB
MKRETKLKSPGNYKLLMFMTLIAVLVSCAQNQDADKVTDAIYQEVDEMPVFPDGDKALISFVSNNTSYPEAAKENGITGRVMVKFVVEKDGSVSNVEIIKSVDPLLDAEAVRVVSTLPDFSSPGKKSGNPVRVQYVIPITFALN